MRNDLQEKQDLLCQAAKAIELMDEQHKQEMDKLNLMLQENSLRIDEQTVRIKVIELFVFQFKANTSIIFIIMPKRLYNCNLIFSIQFATHSLYFPVQFQILL